MIAFRENSDERPIPNAELVTKQLAAADQTLNALRKIKSDWLQIAECPWIAPVWKSSAIQHSDP